MKLTLVLAATAAVAVATPPYVLGRAAAGATQTTIADRFASAEELFEDIQLMGTAQIVRLEDIPEMDDITNEDSPYSPVVQMHGMGDFAADPLGMVPMKKMISNELDGAYVTNIALGDNAIADMLNGFLLPLEDSVASFAAAVQADEKLANGFNAIGYSQGNDIIRGYIHEVNDPPVLNWVSVHGPIMGVAGIPKCNMASTICQELDGLLHLVAYNEFVQNHLTQANYLRDPKHLDQYRAGGHGLANWNQESTKFPKNATYAENLNSLNSTLLVRAMGDTMVWPSISEHFGYYQDGTVDATWDMEDAPWYQEDWFGLKQLNEAGKMNFNSTDGDHLQFTNDQLLGWVDAYFKN